MADASHELRTPVTSLRTNVEVLLAGHELPEDDAQRLLEDVREQTEELSALITDVIELARGEVPLSGVEDVASTTSSREPWLGSSRHHPGRASSCTLEPTVVEGLPDRLGRAVANLLDNAAKWTGGRCGLGGRARRRGDRPRPRAGRRRRRGAIRL